LLFAILKAHLKVTSGKGYGVAENVKAAILWQALG